MNTYLGKMSNEISRSEKMAVANFKRKITISDYLADESSGEVKHEYIYGEIFAMAGTSDRHNRIAGNFFSKIDNHLAESECETFIESVKLKADAQTFYYPDVMVACDDAPESAYFREKPILIIEILSPTTERTDRNEKLSVYKNIPILQEYVIAWQEKMQIEIYRRQADGNWLNFIYGENESEIELESIDLKITLKEIYRRVRFEN